MSTSGATDIEQAISILQRGGLVALPTDTLYGLGAHPFIDSAVRRLYDAKGRPDSKPVPLLLSSPDDLTLVSDQTDGLAHALAAAFWPGALTLVVRCRPDIPSLANGWGATVAVRVPDHPVPRELCARLGAPITGTSANLGGGPNPITAQDVESQLGDKIDLIIDRGPCPGALPSTIVDVSGDSPAILRQGVISRMAIEEVCGLPIASSLPA